MGQDDEPGAWREVDGSSSGWRATDDAAPSQSEAEQGGSEADDAWRPTRPVVELEHGKVPMRVQNVLRILFVLVILSSIGSFIEAVDVMTLAFDFEDAMKEIFLGEVQYPEEAIIRDGIRMYSGVTAILAMVFLLAMVVLPIRYGLLIFGAGRSRPSQYRLMIHWAKILVALEAIRVISMGMMALEDYEIVSISVGFSWNLPLGIGIWWYLRREHVMESYQVPIYILPGGHREKTSI